MSCLPIVILYFGSVAHLLLLENLYAVDERLICSRSHDTILHEFHISLIFLIIDELDLTLPESMNLLAILTNASSENVDKSTRQFHVS